ncbi:MAG: helix-turn-helix transcriptional regulator, partial [Candidatus Aminicenantes bacterium]
MVKKRQRNVKSNQKDLKVSRILTGEIDSKEFGLRLKKIRKQLKLKQEDFGNRIGMKNNYLSGIETGRIKPGFDFFYKITREFRINPYYLFHNEPPMFMDELLPGSFEEKDFGEASQRVHELIRYIERSPMVKFDILGYFTRYRIQNQSL